MQKLVYIDACVREGDSRTRRIAEPIVAALAKKYEITAYHLAQMDIKPLNAESYAARVAGDIPEWAVEAAKTIAAAAPAPSRKSSRTPPRTTTSHSASPAR